jgi:hypothetical protein
MSSNGLLVCNQNVIYHWVIFISALSLHFYVGWNLGDNLPDWACYVHRIAEHSVINAAHIMLLFN